MTTLEIILIILCAFIIGFVIGVGIGSKEEKGSVINGLCYTA